MSSASSSWTVAGGKKNKMASSPKSKKQKQVMESTRKIEPKPPVEESPTIFSALIQEEERREQKAVTSNRPGPSAPAATTKKNAAVVKKAPQKHEEKKVRQLEEAVAEVTVSELESVLVITKSRFPVNPDIWLKDLVSALNLKLDQCPVNGSFYANKPSDYPASALKKPVKDYLQKILSQSSEQTLNEFLNHCITSMMNDVTKGFPSYGFHIFIQLLLHKLPQIGLSNLQTYLAMLKDNCNRSQRALCIIWSLGQAGLSNLGNGLKVWLELMLPVLNVRGLCVFAVQYLENLFRLHPSLKLGSNGTVLSKREFFILFDELYSTQTSLATELRDRMMQLYPKLKVIAFGSQPETTLHNNFFPSFLDRCSDDCSKQKKAELLECLVTCLSVDKHSFSTWRQIYVKHLSNSRILLQHLLSELEVIRPEMDNSLLRETIRSFSVTNDDLLHRSSSSLPSDFSQCISTCNELLQRMSRSRLPSHWFLILLVIVVSAAFGYDVYHSGSVTNCWTYRTLLAAGVIDIVQQAWNRLCLYSSRAWLWLVNNVPVYLSAAAELMLPYVKFCGEKLMDAWRYLSVTLEPHLLVVSSYVVKFVNWLNAQLPFVVTAISQCTDWFLRVLVYVTVSLYGCFNTGVHWIVTNVLTGSWSPENISQLTRTFLTSVQSSLSTVWQWIANTIGH